MNDLDFTLHVLSEAEALWACQTQPRFNLIVSIDACTSMAEQMQRAKTLQVLEEHADQVVSLTFMDTTDELDMDGPRASDADRAKELGAGLRPGDRVLVHCLAGVSRSTAFAMLMLEARGLTREQSFEAVKRVRPCAQPNKLMLRLGSKEQ